MNLFQDVTLAAPQRSASSPPRLLLLAAALALLAPGFGLAQSVPSAAAPGAVGIQTGTQPSGQTGMGTTPAAQGTGPAGRTDGGSQGAQTQSSQADRNAAAQGDRRPVAPAAPSEFQRLVAASLGVDLPIFGASLFAGPPSTFAPVDNIPVTPDYVVGPGDELRIQIFGQVNQQGNFTVDRTGDISYPDVGTLHVAGVRFDQLQPFLRSQLARVYRNFELTVNLGQLRSIQIFVVGAARQPGAYTVSSLSTLINALFASGGPLPQGSLRDIQLLRGGATVVHFDLYALLLHGDKTKDVPLQSGDVLFLPAVGPQVAISGSVNTPAIFEILPGTTATQLIELAGGRTSGALGSEVRIERIYDHSMRTLLDADLSKQPDPLLAGGDIVTVGSIFNRINDSVTLRGNVSFPGRYVWHAGMRITDLVPGREQLITRDYYRRRNELGAPAATDRGVPGSLQLGGSATNQQADSTTANGSSNASRSGGNSLGTALIGGNSPFPAMTDVVLSAPDIDWSYAVVERLDAQTLKTSLLPFSPGKLYLDGDQTQNVELQLGDVVTFFSTADVKVPTVQQTRFVRLEGEFLGAGVYSVQPGETLRHLLARAGGLTPDAYLYGSEFTRESTRRVQQQRLNEYADNLEQQISLFTANSSARALTDRDAAVAGSSAAQAESIVARLRRTVPLGRIVLEVKPDSRTIDSLPDLALEDGDRFVVPRVPSTVSVEGQVYNANSFVYLHGRKEHDYLRQAGGPDRNADRKRMFILRADGSVYSRQYGNVEKATMFPGDTVVVPPQLARGSLLRGIIDASALVGQYGTSLATIGLLATR